MNKWWALAPSLVLMMNSGAKGTEQEPVTVRCDSKNYHLRVYDKNYLATEYNEHLFINSNNELAYARTMGETREIRRVEGGIGEFLQIIPVDEPWNRGLDNEKFLKVGREERMVTAILHEFRNQPAILEQLKRCYIGNRFGDHAAIENTQAYRNFIDDPYSGAQGSQASYKKYAIPVVAGLVVVGVMVKYRAALQRMATKAKDRIVAWWHGSEKKAEHPKAVPQQTSVTA